MARVWSFDPIMAFHSMVDFSDLGSLNLYIYMRVWGVRLKIRNVWTRSLGQFTVYNCQRGDFAVNRGDTSILIVIPDTQLVRR